MENWEQRYQEGSTGWDIGYPTPALCNYFDQLSDKSIKILIPGAGNAYEAEYLFQNGFEQVHVIDIAPSPLKNLKKRVPNFPSEQLIQGDFFEHQGQYDLIVEQTFFCAIPPVQRSAYAKQVHRLLKPGGKLMGLLWSVPLNEDHPPYGGDKKEYDEYFKDQFDYLYFEAAKNSIKPRAGREYFLLAKKKID